MAEVRTPNVKKLTKFGYGNGHVLNDVCASMWFSYLLLYFHNVIHLDNFYAGLIILVGQIADGIFTILVGVLLDRKINFWICNNYGTRKVKFKVILMLMININYIKNNHICKERKIYATLLMHYFRHGMCLGQYASWWASLFYFYQQLVSPLNRIIVRTMEDAMIKEWRQFIIQQWQYSFNLAGPQCRLLTFPWYQW